MRLTPTGKDGAEVGLAAVLGSLSHAARLAAAAGPSAGGAVGSGSGGGRR